MRHGQRRVGRGEPVEPDSGALGQQLPDLDVVALAGALLVAAPGVAVEQPRLACPYVSGVPFMTGMNRVAAEKAVLDVMAQ